ncbi:MAG: O-antigen ligase family protein [Thermomicrobiales bacterium]|nr:O-antigen ligase family protein [Thermomicrobiales bacterium]
MTSLLARKFWLLILAILVIGVAAGGVHWLITVAALGVVACIALLQPAMVAALVVASIPIQSEVMLPFVRGELTVTQLTLFGLIAGWGVIFWKRRIWLDSVVVGFLCLLAAYCFSFLAVDTPSLWFEETYRWAVAGLFYVICRSVITSWDEVRYSLLAVAAGVLGVSLLSIAQIGTGGGSVRVSGTFGTPNTLAAYLEMTVPILLAVLAAARWGSGDRTIGVSEKWFMLAASAIGILVIGFTQSRGGWLGFTAAGVVLWMNVPGRSKFYILGTAAVIGGVFLLTPPGQSQLERFLEIRTETATTDDSESTDLASYDVGAGRGAIWAAARAMIADHPVIGLGAGEFDEHYRQYVPSWANRIPRGHAHNVWLQMGAQAGVIGIAGYSVWYAASIWSLVTARGRTRPSFDRWIIIGVIAVFAAYTMHSLVDYLNVLSLGLQLSVLTAIALNLAPVPLMRYKAVREQRPVITYSEQRACPI